MIDYNDCKSGLVGYTGYVGTNLFRQKSFTFLYNSKNIDDIKGIDFYLLICSGAPGIKWIANKSPSILTRANENKKQQRKIDRHIYIYIKITN